MKFICVADTDVGISRKVNQDSLLVKKTMIQNKKIVMAIVCDGLGGLQKGEVASGTVIQSFSNWFDTDYVNMENPLDLKDIANQWGLLLYSLNKKIYQYGKKHEIRLGTTFTGIFFIEESYLICHIGDTRVYEINDELSILTEDHTLVAKEVKEGKLTVQQALVDPRQNILLRCVGCFEQIKVEAYMGQTKKGVYMLCSDGFRHKITVEEFKDKLVYNNLKDKDVLQKVARELIEMCKQRNEKDNISVILIKIEE